MGLTIHYSGSFWEKASLEEMILEVKDIADANHWKYHIFNRHFPEKNVAEPKDGSELYGIVLYPENSEPLFLTFLSNRRMASPDVLQAFKKPAKHPEGEYAYMLFVKTQYAGIETHRLIINLLRHLDKKYFADFRVKDEGKFWETNDPEILEKEFRLYINLTDDLGISMDSIPRKEGESHEDYFLRLARIIKPEKNDD